MMAGRANRQIVSKPQVDAIPLVVRFLAKARASLPSPLAEGEELPNRLAVPSVLVIVLPPLRRPDRLGRAMGF